MTALPLEFKAVCSYLDNLGDIEHPQGNIYTKGQFVGEKGTWDVLVAEVGKHNPIASQETERAITFHKPSVALFVGVSGGVKDVKLGDVVIADKVYYYESGKWGEGQNGKAEFFLRPMVYNSGYRLVEQAKALARKDEWQELLDLKALEPRPSAIVGPLAAGESVVSSKASEVYSLINKSYGDSIALAMEDFGFLRAAYANPDVQALVIRGISDLIEKKSETDSEGWQDVAAKRASVFAFKILSKVSCERLPEKVSSIFDQRGQTVNGPQTNIYGDAKGAILSGTFSGSVGIHSK
jgi:nucleoside phosphorylase